MTIAFILEILLGFDRKRLKLHQDMKNNHFEALLIGLLTLKQWLLKEAVDIKFISSGMTAMDY